MNNIEMLEKQMFYRKVKEAFELTHKFLDWWMDFYNLNDKIPTITQILKQFRKHTKFQYKCNVLKKYKIVHMLLEYQDDLYFNGYIKTKFSNTTGLKNNNYLSYAMTVQYRKMLDLLILKNVYNEMCKQEIERKRNKQYALNIIHHKKMLPYEIIKYEVGAF